MRITERKDCRSCGSTNLVDVLDLGDLFVCGFTDTPQPDAPKAPLQVVLCKECGLIQLRHTVDPESLYRTYWYRSGVNQSMRDALGAIVGPLDFDEDGELALRNGDAVLDTGCNDGYLLSCYCANPYRVGFEPATALAQDAKAHADWIIPDFFYSDVLGDAKFKVITSVAMFYDLDDPNAFVADIKKVLAPDGVWVVEMQYLVDVLRQNAFDFFVHEHLCCYSLTSLKHLLDRHGLVIVDCVQTDTNGGSFRCYVKHCTRLSPLLPQPSQRVQAMLAREHYMELDSRFTYEAFAARIDRICTAVMDYVDLLSPIECRDNAYLCGASTKGNTLTQYFGLHKYVKGASERNPEKHGKYTAGTCVPIVSEEEARWKNLDLEEINASIMIVCPWHFKSEIIGRERSWLQAGGKLLFPLPTPTLVDKYGERGLAPSTVAADRKQPAFSDTGGESLS